MPVAESKAARRSPVFERLNLDRLKKSSQNLTRAEELIRRAETQLEQSQKIIDKSANRLSGICPAGGAAFHWAAGNLHRKGDLGFRQAPIVASLQIPTRIGGSSPVQWSF